jgi:repressor LexA
MAKDHEMISEVVLAEIEATHRSLAQRPLASYELGFLPILGKIAAGEPLYMPGENSQDSIGEIVLDGTRYQLLSLGERKPQKGSFSPSQEYFVLTVSGDSMIGANIRNGDLLLVKKQDSEPEQGAIAVFQEEDSGPMVKKFRREANRIYLESANPRYKRRIYDKDSPTLRIIGAVVAILEELGD